MSGTSGVGDAFSSQSITSSTAITGKGVQDLTMDDFFKLLVAQMTNQDMMNPTDNTEMVAQMAQFSTLQGMQSIVEYQQLTYAMSYNGKEVTIANVNETTGNMETITGVVESVTFYDGTPQVVVNGTAYPLHTVMEINNPNSSGNALNQAASYIGKQVTLTATRDDGLPYDLKGIVESVTLKGGQAYVVIDGKSYPVSSITDVGTVTVKEDDDTGSDSTGSTSEEDDNSGLDGDEE